MDATPNGTTPGPHGVSNAGSTTVVGVIVSNLASAHTTHQTPAYLAAAALALGHDIPTRHLGHRRQ